MPSTILIIEDEHHVRTLMALILEREGFRVFEAASSDEAASIWHEHSVSINLIVSDIWMAGISGPELVQFLVREKPSVNVLFVSGLNSDLQPEFQNLLQGETLQKPFVPADLIAAVKRALAR